MKKLTRVAALLYSFIFTGCAAINSYQGLLLKNKAHRDDPQAGQHERPSYYGQNEGIRLESPPVVIKLNQALRRRTLSFGPDPIIPLPVIPWPPGIISAFKDFKYQGARDEKLVVEIKFYSSWYLKNSGQFKYDASQASLKFGTYDITPSTKTVKSFRITGKRPNVDTIDTTPECISSDGSEIVLKTKPTDICENVSIYLTFDINPNKLNRADLHLGNVLEGEKSLAIPDTTIFKGRVFKLWVHLINT